MIAHLAGRLLEKHVQRLVVDVGGVGYEVIVPLSTFYGVGEPGAAIALRIHTHVREDALQLFGFATSLELSLFERLIAVNGIGPKVALSVLSGIEPPDLVRAIRQADLARLIGAGRQKVNRHLCRWLVDGTLARDGRALVIRDRDTLSAIAEAGED